MTINSNETTHEEVSTVSNTKGDSSGGKPKAINRQYKDRLFKFLFGNPEHRDWTLSLYNAVNGTCYNNPEDIVFTTIENAVYMGMKNDISLLLADTMSLYEQQSTYNPNMPMRFLVYTSMVYSAYIEDPDNGISYRKTAKTKDSEKFILPKEVVDYYESGRNVIFYCHKGRRKQEDWEQAKVQIRDYIRDAQILAVTFHRGTQRSYIFVLHPDCCLEYERILTAFLDSVWGGVFTWEDVDGNVLPAEYSTKNENKIQLESLDCRFSVCKVTDYSGIDLTQPFCFTGTTDEENSLVCPEALVPDNTTDRDDGWRGFRIIGQLDFSLIGILAGISKVLASNGIGIFAISTYNTDYILTKEENFEKSLKVLKNAGYKIK